MNLQLKESLDVFDLRSVECKTLILESEALKNNPLRDAHIRRNPVVLPRAEAPKHGWPVVFVLSGYAGNGSKYFSDKGFESNFVQVLDMAIQKGEAPRAVYVFVDAWTCWGGAQFINSAGMGNYQDYVVEELVPAVERSFAVDQKAGKWCVFGGSSGGYGALHLSSLFPQVFPWAVAIAPDCFFEVSLLPEVYKAIPIIEKMGGVGAVFEELNSGRFLSKRDSFTVLNAIAMTLCYSPAANKDGLEFPINRNTGLRDDDIWMKWKNKDPVYFLSDRKDGLKKLSGLYLDVGTRDEFHLQYGARQIKEQLKKIGVPLSYSEFDGTHSDIGARREDALIWLHKKWSGSN